jgi:hypothetical protein
MNAIIEILLSEVVVCGGGEDSPEDMPVGAGAGVGAGRGIRTGEEDTPASGSKTFVGRR